MSFSTVQAFMLGVSCFATAITIKLYTDYTIHKWKAEDEIFWEKDKRKYNKATAKLAKIEKSMDILGYPKGRE